MKRRKGFTLIELAIVLAILVVVSGIVIIRIAGWSSEQSLQASARALGNTIRTWRERARIDEAVYTLVIEGRSYRVERDKEVLRRSGLGHGETFEANCPARLVFTARGALPETCITLRNGHGERVTLRIGALSNEVDYRKAP